MMAQSPYAIRPGAVIGPYHLRRLLGKGGMGEVYLAEQRPLGRQVAIKLLPRDLLDDPRARERFQREVQALARLEHPHICPLLDAGEHDGAPYSVMEFLPGRDLAEVIRSERLDEARVCRIVIQLAEAAQYAHDRGIFHRDIKPGNVILGRRPAPWSPAAEPPDPEDHAYLIDFGLAHRDDLYRLTLTREIVGTPAYAAPERLLRRERSIGPPTDVYALGVLLYEMTTGKLPFEDPSVGQVIHRILKCSPVRPSRWCPGMSRDLEVIILRCLEKKPGRRYASAEALRQDLERVLEGDPIPSRPPGLSQRLARLIRRNRVALLCVLNAVAALADKAR